MLLPGRRCTLIVDYMSAAIGSALNSGQPVNRGIRGRRPRVQDPSTPSSRIGEYGTDRLGACVVGSVSAAVIEFRVVLEQKGIVG